MNILQKVNFKEVDKLVFSWNNISDINILDKVIFVFKRIKDLDLSFNKISDIKVLKIVNFKELEELNLINNKISEKENSFLFEYLNSKIPRLKY